MLRQQSRRPCLDGISHPSYHQSAVVHGHAVLPAVSGNAARLALLHVEAATIDAARVSKMTVGREETMISIHTDHRMTADDLAVTVAAAHAKRTPVAASHALEPAAHRQLVESARVHGPEGPAAIVTAVTALAPGAPITSIAMYPVEAVALAVFGNARAAENVSARTVVLLASVMIVATTHVALEPETTIAGMALEIGLAGVRRAIAINLVVLVRMTIKTGTATGSPGIGVGMIRKGGVGRGVVLGAAVATVDAETGSVCMF
jgi:hypothetical protein